MREMDEWMDGGGRVGKGRWINGRKTKQIKGGIPPSEGCRCCRSETPINQKSPIFAGVFEATRGSDKMAQKQRRAVAAYKSHHPLIVKEVWKK